MVIKTDVTPEEKAVIKQNAKAEGKSMTAYLRDRALCNEPSGFSGQFIKCIETQSMIACRMNEIATTVLRNKVIYEAEILELLDRMTALETNTASILKEVRKHGNIGK